MLQDIRQSTKGTAAKIVVGLIVITFAFFGIESILVGGGDNEIAKVNGEEIYPQELQQSIDTQRRRLISAMGENLDPAMLEEDRLRGPALEALINRRLLKQSAQEMDLSISEQEIGAVVGGMEQFQADGRFSPEVYKSVLSTAGFTPGSFKQGLYDDMLINQLRGGIAGTEFVTSAELELSGRVILESRDVHYFIIPLEKFASDSPISEAGIEGYYVENETDYQTQEVVDIDYIELSVDDFREPVEENAILEAYELAKNEAQYLIQNRVSHILFESGAADQADQVVLAQERLAGGVPFAEVAMELSQDVGSSSRGGDLGFSSGDAFPLEMEVVIAKLEPGVVSEPVETDAGIHLLLVTERKGGEEPRLDEIREQLKDSIQTDEARVVLLRSVESLKDLSFNAEDLSYPASELTLDVQQIDAVARFQDEGLFSNTSLLKAAFSEDVLVEGHNSDVIELPEDRFVVMRVRKHHVPELLPLAAVRDEIVEAVQEKIARAAVAAEADRALAQMRTGVTMEQFTETENYERQIELGIDRRNNIVPIEVLRRAFEMPAQSAEDMSTADYIEAQNGDAIVIELVRVNEGDVGAITDIELQQLRQLLGSESGSLVDKEFQQSLQDHADITVL
ncbi:MAG: SurA N-terminal domain-containing protein [Halioglobus sp.]|nr:SurA N-terminal domain-containing protein [Halioglobus sp.]